MPTRILEVHAAAAIPRIDLAGTPSHGIRPVGNPPVADTGEDLVELGFRDEKGVVLRSDLPGSIQIVESDLVVDFHAHERSERDGFAEAEQLGKECGGGVLVARLDDCVIQLDGHDRSPRCQRVEMLADASVFLKALPAVERARREAGGSSPLLRACRSAAPHQETSSSRIVSA